MVQGVTTKDLKDMKKEGEKITLLTAYSSPKAKILDKVGIDAILVGDSVGNTVLGYQNTLPVSMDEMINHTKAVERAIDDPLLIGDMPFLSYQTSSEEAVKNAGRFLKEGNAEAVKVEGGREIIDAVEKIIDAGIPVLGHLGLTPQKIHQFGGYQPHGKTKEEAAEILKDAKRLEKAGVFGIVLESVTKQVSKIVTEAVDVPTIGIGAGPYCDGQVLVIHDMLGISDFTPKFVKEYTDLDSVMQEAVKDFKEEVKSQEFPDQEHTYEMEKEEFEKFEKYLEE